MARVLVWSSEAVEDIDPIAAYIDCIAAGESKEEVLALIRDAIELHLEGLKEDGQPIPAPSSTSELVEVEAA